MNEVQPMWYIYMIDKLRAAIEERYLYTISADTTWTDDEWYEHDTLITAINERIVLYENALHRCGIVVQHNPKHNVQHRFAHCSHPH